jgi:hypothetical protein
VPVAQPSDEATDWADPADVYVAGLPEGTPVDAASPLRSAILDGLRPLVEKDLGQPVKFVVDSLEVSGDWAGIRGRAVRPGGGGIDFRKTRYASRVKSGSFDDGFEALLHRDNGRWRVIEYAYGRTDELGGAWLYEHEVPAAVLF